MLRTRIAALVLLTLSGAAAAQSMNADAFYKRAVALKAKGPLALVSGDLKPMMREAKTTGLHVRSTRLATLKAGKQPRYCPPEGINGWAPRNSSPRSARSPRPNARGST